MERIGFLLKVKPEKLDEYRRRHAAVWPEMLDALRRSGWRNYSIFAREDGLLFGYREAADSLKASQEAMSQEEVNARWQASMAPYFEDLSDGVGSARMAVLAEVFHLD